MNYREYGNENSSIMIFLHGGGLSWWNYRKAAELLQDRYHVILPVLDGHAGSERDFVSIEENAAELIEWIREKYGHVCLIGGVSLGAQIVVEMLEQDAEICDHAVIESASVIRDGFTAGLTGPSVNMSYGLIGKKWFARMQSDYLGISSDLFEDYYRDTKQMSRENLAAVLQASLLYELKNSPGQIRTKVMIAAGSREQKVVLRSAKLLKDYYPDSVLCIQEGYKHGEYSMNHPEKFAEDAVRFIEEKRSVV